MEPVCHLTGTEERHRDGLQEVREWGRQRNSSLYIMLWENARVLKSGPKGLPHFRGTSRNRSERWEEAKL